MKKSYVLGFSGLSLLVAALSYDLYTFEPAGAKSAQAFNVAATPAAVAGAEMVVYKNTSCNCCDQWVEHIRSNDINVVIRPVDNMDKLKAQLNVPQDMMSCHTAVMDGLVVEGHVPAKDIHAYSAQRQNDAGDKTVGLAVPGMPHGAPGMETGREDEFAVLAFTANGESEVVKTYDEY